MERTVNDGTPWANTFDDSIQVDSFVVCTRKWSGKSRGVWKVIDKVPVIVDHGNVNHYRTRNDGKGGYTTHAVMPPMGMFIRSDLKLVKVMDEEYGKPYRRDKTSARIEACDVINPTYVADLETTYNDRLKNLGGLLRGTW